MLFRWKILLSFPHHSYDTTLVRRLKCEIRPQGSIYPSLFTHLKKKIGREKLRNKSTFRCGIIFQPFLSGAGLVNGRQMYLQVSDSDVSSSCSSIFFPLFFFLLLSLSSSEKKILEEEWSPTVICRTDFANWVPRWIIPAIVESRSRRIIHSGESIHCCHLYMPGETALCSFSPLSFFVN